MATTTGHESEAINVQGLKASLQKLKTDHIDGKAPQATTLAGYGITDAYTKSETYTKTEVNGLVDTPHQNYVTVEATSQTTAATDVLPASGQAADTIYRVANWDGSANSGAGAFDVTKYSEYAWDDVSNPNKYVFLCVKSQLDEVFDISVYNNNAKYADLAAALGNNGANVPQSLQRGGMSIKFVQSSDNRYVQYFLTKNQWSSSSNDWEKVNLEGEVDTLQFHVFGGLNYKEGYYLNVSGEEIEDENSCISNYIELPNSARNTGLAFYYGTYVAGHYLILYNAQKEKIDYFGAQSGNTYRTLSSSQVGNAVYARFSFAKNYDGKMTDRADEPVAFYNAGIVKGIEEKTNELEQEIESLPHLEYIPTIGSIKVVTSNGIALNMLSKIFPQMNVQRKNLFNKQAIKDGYYIKSDGTYAVSDSFACSTLIPVEPDTDYHLSKDSDEGVGNINSFGFFYKDDGTKVLFNTGSTDVHTPIGCYAIEFSYIKVYESTVQFERGMTRTTYESFLSSDIMTFLSNIGEPSADSESILPRQLFVIKGEQNSFYHSEYCRNYNDNQVYADKSGGSFAFNKRCWRVEENDSVSGNLVFALRYRKTDAILKSFNVPIRVGLKTNTANNIKVNIIGDSFCYGGHYIKQIADCCDNADFVGMRKTTYYPTLFCEGRGGWTLAYYFSPICSDITLTHMQPFSPFMHAQGYNYYGVIEFWAAIVNGTSQYPYGTNGFDNYTSWFGTDGRKLSPSVNDLMYNTTAGKYEYWNGSAWQQLTTAPDFAFDYSKYISIWDIDSPDFVVIQLGTNDFFAGNANMTEWFQRMDAVVASIKSYATSVSKTINILVCTVLTASGTPNNAYMNGVIKRNHYYYDARKAVIEHFDPEENYTNNKVSVVDTGIVVDNDYGFQTSDVLPFAYYEGSARELFDTNGVHPDIAGYKQFGNPIAGAIQYLRS